MKCNVILNDSIVVAENVRNFYKQSFSFDGTNAPRKEFQEIKFGPLPSGDYTLVFKDYDFVYKPYSISLRNELKMELHIKYVEISEYISDTSSVGFASFQGVPVFFANVAESKNCTSFQYKVHQKHYYENHLIENSFLIKPKDHSFTYHTVKTYSYLKEKRKQRVLKAYNKDKKDESSSNVLPDKKRVEKKRKNPYSISKRYRARYNR